MVKRRKRLQKGIESMEEQLKIHEEKLKKAEEEGNEDLADYYKREISAKKKEKERREDILEKQ